MDEEHSDLRAVDLFSLMRARSQQDGLRVGSQIESHQFTCCEPSETILTRGSLLQQAVTVASQLSSIREEEAVFIFTIQSSC